MKPFILVVVLVSLLSACAQYTMVKPQQLEVAETYTVQTPIAWNKFTRGDTELWTIDGLLLQSLFFSGGLETGDTLFEVDDDKVETMPKFDSGMTLLEVEDFVSASFAAMKFHRIETTNFRPMMFGSVSGFRFDVYYVLESGLEKQALVAGSKIGDKLYVIIYTGTRLYYFEKHLEDVENIIDSIQII